jgi:hypothetical protein
MGLYSKYVLPKVVHFACGRKPNMKQRQKVVPLASGRVLKVGIGSGDASVRRWQDRVNPIWKRFSGGCHLNRPIPTLIEASGFHIKGMDTMYLPGWRPGTFNYWGTATAR